MSAGLEASTVTPGMTAPDVSRTVPAIPVCAAASAGIATTHARVTPSVTTILGPMPHLHRPTALMHAEPSCQKVTRPLNWNRRPFNTPAPVATLVTGTRHCLPYVLLRPRIELALNTL